jgi:hypothetical protein
MGKRNTIHKLPEYKKNESFDTIVGYVLVTIGLFAPFALFFAVAMIFGTVEVFGK